jgi:hypothetical protein
MGKLCFVCSLPNAFSGETAGRAYGTWYNTQLKMYNVNLHPQALRIYRYYRYNYIMMQIDIVSLVEPILFRLTPFYRKECRMSRFNVGLYDQAIRKILQLSFKLVTTKIIQLQK